MRGLGVFLALAFPTLSTPTPLRADTSQLIAPSPEFLYTYYQENAPHWTDLPDHVLQALMAAEDLHFLDRPLKQSTFATQMSNWHNPSDTNHPAFRSLYQVAFAFSLSEALSHEQVLNWYANEIYLGQGCYGVAHAAQAYWGKPAADLSLAEAAYLAALPKAPAYFHPIRNHDAAVTRRNFVLSEMVVPGFITPQMAQAAMSEPLAVMSPLGQCQDQTE
ncbi:transglycosylase domain-containing protein [Aestuariibius sp. HNIBRBA575]|uniref:transglycosylase domain-containing protein n=1 Tax=Aestuariibius sp. HNIBRBA575 TaxID=3233343 RepID=UPI0034A11533